ncbi:peptidoglycan DD-metalloendopeptidase family protein [Kribbella sp. NPDC051620]|uniref:peptidoglycan DD-metalloendopeptidase family protein n=1 Tax=Kribbella sp. NPDC051620 TaxID=3364120 RepID=UPI00378FA847
MPLTLLATAALLAPTTPTPASPTVPSGAPAQPGAVWPLSPRPEVVRGFEPPPKPWLPGHRGLDLRGSPGQQVRSATSGTVTYAGPLAGRGVIVITTGPLRTTYEPVIPTVRVGTLVTPGIPLGHLSAAASHCAPATCLHWGLLESTTYLNPLSLLPHRPVRLLPTTPHGAPPPQPANTPPSATPHPRSATPSDPQQRPPQPTQPTAQASPSPRGGLASTMVVSLAAVATLIGSLLIRRH